MGGRLGNAESARRAIASWVGDLKGEIGFRLLHKARQRHRLAGSQRLLQQGGDIQLPGHGRVKENGPGALPDGLATQATLARAPRRRGDRPPGGHGGPGATGGAIEPWPGGRRNSLAQGFDLGAPFFQPFLDLLLRPLLRRLVVSPGRAQVILRPRSGRGNRARTGNPPRAPDVWRPRSWRRAAVPARAASGPNARRPARRQWPDRRCCSCWRWRCRWPPPR